MWSSLDLQIQAATIGAVAVLLAALAGFGGLILQLRSQNKQSLKAIAENERRRLKARLYDSAISEVKSLIDATIGIDGYLRTMQFQLAVAAAAHEANLRYQVPDARFLEVIGLHRIFSDAIYRFIVLIENSQIIDPRIIVFRTAMNAAAHDIGQSFQNEFHLRIMPALPMEGPDGRLFPYNPPSIASSDDIRELVERVGSSFADVTSYAEDFSVELQNLLLGDLFGTVVSHRTPIDPQSQVISLSNAKALEAWFSANTAWGRHIAEVEARTRAAFEDAGRHNVEGGEAISSTG